jgi:hypothetical protein
VIRFDRTLHRAVFDSLPIPWSPRVPRERLISIPFLDLSLQSDLTMQGSSLFKLHDIGNVESNPHSVRQYAHPIFSIGWALSLGRELEHLCHALSATFSVELIALVAALGTGARLSSRARVF